VGRSCDQSWRVKNKKHPKKIQIIKGHSEEVEVRIFGNKVMQAKAKTVIDNLVKKQENYNSKLRTDIVAFQPSVGRDVKTGSNVTENQPLIGIKFEKML